MSIVVGLQLRQSETVPMKLMPLQIIDIHHVHPVICFLHPLEMNFYGFVCTPNFMVDHLYHTKWLQSEATVPTRYTPED